MSRITARSERGRGREIEVEIEVDEEVKRYRLIRNKSQIEVEENTKKTVN